MIDVDDDDDDGDGDFSFSSLLNPCVALRAENVRTSERSRVISLVRSFRVSPINVILMRYNCASERIADSLILPPAPSMKPASLQVNLSRYTRCKYGRGFENRSRSRLILAISASMR